MLRRFVAPFAYDGKQLVQTLGETDLPGDDATHFGLPQDLAFLPDGSILVADGLRNTRIVKLDKDGKFIKQWGTKGNGPGQFSGLHSIDRSSTNALRIRLPCRLKPYGRLHARN